MCWVFFFSAVHLCAFTRRAFFFFCSVLFFFFPLFSSDIFAALWQRCSLTSFFLSAVSAELIRPDVREHATESPFTKRKEEKRKADNCSCAEGEVKWNGSDPAEEKQKEKKGKQCTKKHTHTHTHTHTSRTNADVLIWKHSREKKNCNNQQQQ